MNKILVINSTDRMTVVIGPLSLDDAKIGQREIIKKIPEGSATVVIDELITLEEYMKTLEQ